MKHIFRYQALGHIQKYDLKSFIKLAIFFVYTPICSLIFLFRRSNKKQKKYKVSIAAIFKNESEFLKEWICYHKLIGVEHFYLYNNFSNDSYLQVLEPFIIKGDVTLIDWPIKFGQTSAYENCIDKYSFESNWIAFIDIDEFLCLKSERFLTNFLDKFSKYPSVMVNWKMFGTSGVVSRDPRKLIIEQFKSSWEHYCDVGKSIINTNFQFEKCKTPHYFTATLYKIPIPAVDEFKHFSMFWHFWFDPFMRNSEIQINHYWSRSYNDYLYKDGVRGDAMSKTAAELRRDNSYSRFDYHETMNRTRDYTIQRFLILLKNKMGEQG